MEPSARELTSRTLGSYRFHTPTRPGARPFTLERLLQQFDSRNLHGTLTLPSACCCSLATSTRWNVEVLG